MEREPFFVNQESYLRQMAVADIWMAKMLDKLEAEGFVKEHPNQLVWTKRDADGNIIAKVRL